MRALINEWMAANSATLADPADGDFDDWFELYNPDPYPVDLSGYQLTDDPIGLVRSAIANAVRRKGNCLVASPRPAILRP